MSNETQGGVARSGREIGWRSVGSGPPLVLVNGYAATAADWDPAFLEALGDGFRVILPDNRGMGTSPWGDDAEELTVGSMADDVLALADALDLATFALVGWSMGGFISQTIAARVPERITGLALMGTDAGGPEATLAEPETWARLLDDSGTAREQATRLLGLLFPEPLASQIDAQVGDLVAQAKAALDPRALRAQEAAMLAWHQVDPPVVPSGAPRTFVAHGGADVVIPPANAQRNADRWGAPPPVVFAGGGHAFMAQFPVDLAARLSEHLS